MSTTSSTARYSETTTSYEAKKASLFRMVMPEHVCPFGLKAKALLKRKGFAVDDHPLKSRADTDAFKEQHHVKSTPQVFIEGKRIGGYDALREHFGMRVKSKDETTYQPVIATFGTAALLAVAARAGAREELLSSETIVWFVAFSMGLLALLKLRDLGSFTNQFLGYDLLAQRVVPYAYLYPFVELLAGAAMLASFGTPFAAASALCIGTVGAVSVFKAVYIDKRELKCACVGGESKVPLGFVSLTENLMMVGMAIWMFVRH